MKSFLFLTLCFFGLIILSSAYSNPQLINIINSDPSSTWKAGKNPVFEGWSLDRLRSYFRSGTFGTKDPSKIKPFKGLSVKLPVNFDSAQNWPNCSSMLQIRDQAECGSCWAFGAVEAFTDRYCVATKQQQNPILSAQFMVTCDQSDSGCEGGEGMSAFQFIQGSGLPTESCQPYNIPTCPPSQEPCLNFVTTPDCLNYCYGNQSENINHRYYCEQPYYLSEQSQMQEDLYQYGPFEVCFTVYEDFLSYKSGVYSHKSGQALGGHCVKLVGWGVENGVNYWKCANSWTTYWGDKGYFKILRGRDECGIESDAVGALPKLN